MAATAVLINTIIFGMVLFGVSKLLWPRIKKSHPLPPGPKPWLILGNITDLPPSGVPEWEHWLKHKDLYGPISSVTVMGTTIVILNSAQMAFELLEKRSSIYSSRPRLVFGNEMCGWENFTASQVYNDHLRAYRRRIHTVLGTKAALSRFYPLQEAEVHHFLLAVLEKPQGLVEHIRTEAGAIILKMGYGYTVDWHKRDPLVDIADKALAQFSAATVPGAWMVDTIPLLRYLPEWMPGTGFKKTAREWKATVMELAEKPMEFVRNQVSAGKYESSYVSSFYEKAGEAMEAEEEFVLKWSAASLYTGGADTSVSTMATFFLAMTLHPEVQRKAQEEIDRVVGSERLPTFDDRDNLPYIEAVVKEAFRWHPIAPISLPHVTTADDIYEGYLIPKGAMVIQNIWWFTHDPAVYSDPASFDPVRHLGPDPCPDPRNYVFGFGRRICPGKLLADSSVWLTVARSLAVFDITKGVDEAGREIEPEVHFTPGIISHPVPFQATIKPRSSKHEYLIRQAEALHPWERSDAEELQKINI